MKNIPFCYVYKRKRINSMLKEITEYYKLNYKDVYNRFYTEFTIITGNDIHLIYKTFSGESKLNVLTMLEPEHGFLTQFYKIIQSNYNDFKNDKSE